MSSLSSSTRTNIKSTMYTRHSKSLVRCRYGIDQHVFVQERSLYLESSLYFLYLMDLILNFSTSPVINCFVAMALNLLFSFYCKHLLFLQSIKIPFMQYFKSKHTPFLHVGYPISEIKKWGNWKNLSNQTYDNSVPSRQL